MDRHIVTQAVRLCFVGFGSLIASLTLLALAVSPPLAA